MNPTCHAHLQNAQRDLEGMRDCQYEMTRKEYEDTMLILEALKAICLDLSGPLESTYIH